VRIAHTTLTMCFVTVIVQARLIDFDRSPRGSGDGSRLLAAAHLPDRDLAADLPAIASGWMLAFTLSLDDFVIASFTHGPGATTLPIRIYSEVRLGVKPETNAICTLMIASVALMVRDGVAAVETLCGLAMTRPPRSLRRCELVAARARRPEQIDQKPHRHDHERSEQHVRQRPVERAASDVRDCSGVTPASRINSCRR
jgi:hypothetical protein